MNPVLRRFGTGPAEEMLQAIPELFAQDEQAQDAEQFAGQEQDEHESQIASVEVAEEEGQLGDGVGRETQKEERDSDVVAAFAGRTRDCTRNIDNVGINSGGPALVVLELILAEEYGRTV